MAADYNLVILGGTAYAREAALQAVGYGARVALVEPPDLFAQRQQQKYLLKGLQQLGETLQRQQTGAWFGLSGGGELDWRAVLEWGAIASETQQGQLSVESMSVKGVDVVVVRPRLREPRLRYRSRSLLVTAGDRQLKTRSVLAAFGCSLDSCSDLLALDELPKTVEIYGSEEQAVLWAQALSQVGSKVVLYAKEVLPEWDSDIQRMVKLWLLNSGVVIADPAAVKVVASKVDCTLYFSHVAPAVSLPLLFSFPVFPPFKGIYARAQEPYLTTNKKLQTRHSRLFACGSILGGSSDENLARYEANIAVKNALFLPTAAINYAKVPIGDAWFAKVGLTEQQAIRHYGDDVQVFVTSSANADCLAQVSPNPDYCKLVCANGKLLGLHLVGVGAGDSVRLLAPMVGRFVKDISVVSGDGLLSLVETGITRSQQRKWQPERWRRDWAENWFNWCRSR